MLSAAGRLAADEAAREAALSARALSAVLGCTVTRCPGRPGRVEAEGLPGVHVLIGTPEEVAAEGRRVLLASWLRVLGRQGANRSRSR